MEYSRYIELDTESLSRLEEIEAKMELLKKERTSIYNKFKEKNELPVGRMAIARYKEQYLCGWVDNARIVYVMGYYPSNVYTNCIFGKTYSKKFGNEVTFHGCTNVTYEIVDDETTAKQIVKEIKKGINKQKKEIEKLDEERLSKLNPEEYEF